MKIYTKSGDKGYTSLYGERHKKSHPTLEVLGVSDLVVSYIGLLNSHLNQYPELLDLHYEIQSNLLNINSYIAGYIKTINTDVAKIESTIDELTAQLPELKNFILPNGSQSSTLAQVLRSQTRSLERRIVELEDHLEAEHYASILSFVNRMSDYFFTLGRYLNHRDNIKDIIWKI